MLLLAQGVVGVFVSELHWVKVAIIGDIGRLLRYLASCLQTIFEVL